MLRQTALCSTSSSSSSSLGRLIDSSRRSFTLNDVCAFIWKPLSSGDEERFLGAVEGEGAQRERDREALSKSLASAEDDSDDEMTVRRRVRRGGVGLLLKVGEKSSRRTRLFFLRDEPNDDCEHAARHQRQATKA